MALLAWIKKKMVCPIKMYMLKSPVIQRCLRKKIKRRPNHHQTKSCRRGHGQPASYPIRINHAVTGLESASPHVCCPCLSVSSWKPPVWNPPPLPLTLKWAVWKHSERNLRCFTLLTILTAARCTDILFTFFF